MTSVAKSHFSCD